MVFLLQTHVISIIVLNWQHCNDHTPSDSLYMIFTANKFELFIQVLSLDHVLIQERTTRTLRMHLVFCSYFTLPLRSTANTMRLSAVNDIDSFEVLFKKRVFDFAELLHNWEIHS